MAAPRAIVIHGHFYQPPRENPWLDAVEVQDSAAPHHDWNERVTAECYAPNTAARRVGADNRILDVVNNFEKISFNVGPTLMVWLARHAPDIYARILEADRVSARAQRGHGNAIAQVHNHMILPLASRRDKVTQVRWGLEDFRSRFGREPEGMWLPETAVDEESLEVLAEAGITFTILAPHQCRRVRPLGSEAWEEVGTGVDPSRPYLWRGPRGLSLALFFYDGPISRAIAFEPVLKSGEQLVAKLRGGFVDARTWPELVHCATDGESYGHHSQFGDMALAAAIKQIEVEGFAQLTNYGAFLASYQPAWEAQIHERTSWSCAHGVERWRADCGCRVDGQTHQRWRGPLREALDAVRDQIDAFFEGRAGALLKDAWAARDAYVEVVLDPRPERWQAFLAAQQRVALDPASQLEARRLLEMQRHRLLMYTSCGWFFDELAALEPVQILKYASMALQYLRDLGGPSFEDEFVRRLAAAPTNVPAFPHGGEVYRRLVKPSAVDVPRVIAHYAISGLLEDYPEDARIYAFRVQRLEEAREGFDGTAARVGHVRVAWTITGEEMEAVYAVFHFGGHDFSCGVRPGRDAADYERVRADLLDRYASLSLADVVRGLAEHFPGQLFSLTDLFLDGRRRVVADVIRAVLERHEATYRRIWEENRKLVHYLREAEATLHEDLAIVARHVLEGDVLAELERAAGQGAIPERAFEVAAEAKALGLTLDLARAREATGRAVAGALDEVVAAPSAPAVARAVALIEGANRLGARFGLGARLGLWAAQNRFFALWKARPADRAVLEPLAGVLGFDLSSAT